MQANIQVSWTPTGSAGLVSQRVEVYSPMGQLVTATLGAGDSSYQFTAEENQYLNIYVYSLNSIGQGNSAYTGYQVPAYTTEPPPEAIPDAPSNLSASFIGWV